MIDLEDVEVISEDIPGWLVANEGAVTVALEVEISEELRNEGMAREIINRVQNMRKDNGLEITDRIVISISQRQETDAAIVDFGDSSFSLFRSLIDHIECYCCAKTFSCCKSLCDGCGKSCFTMVNVADGTDVAMGFGSFEFSLCHYSFLLVKIK